MFERTTILIRDKIYIIKKHVCVDKFERFHDVFSKLFKFFEIEKDQYVKGEPSTIILTPPYLGGFFDTILPKRVEGVLPILDVV